VTIQYSPPAALPTIVHAIACVIRARLVDIVQYPDALRTLQCAAHSSRHGSLASCPRPTVRAAWLVLGCRLDSSGAAQSARPRWICLCLLWTGALPACSVGGPRPRFVSLRGTFSDTVSPWLGCRPDDEWIAAAPAADECLMIYSRTTIKYEYNNLSIVTQIVCYYFEQYYLNILFTLWS